ncbi:MAG: hypothetical protein R3B72_21485 [Polyangiaceae bacterium]
MITAIDFLVAVNLGEPMAIGDEGSRLVGAMSPSTWPAPRASFRRHLRPDESHPTNLLVDAATVAAKTLGKKALVSLESRDEMPADLEEIHEGLEEGGVTLIHRRGP